jgi:hypothetical protein
MHKRIHLHCRAASLLVALSFPLSLAPHSFPALILVSLPASLPLRLFLIDLQIYIYIFIRHTQIGGTHGCDRRRSLRAGGSRELRGPAACMRSECHGRENLLRR